MDKHKHTYSTQPNLEKPQALIKVSKNYFLYSSVPTGSDSCKVLCSQLMIAMSKSSPPKKPSPLVAITYHRYGSVNPCRLNCISTYELLMLFI